MAKHEIGIVYRNGNRLFIAVTDSLLVNCKKGIVTEVRPYTRYDVVRSISVEELCEDWELSMDQFDVAMGAYLNPTNIEIKSRPRGARRPKVDDEEYWKRHRTGRIARPKL